MAQTIDYIMLDPETMEPVETGGQRYKRITLDSGSVSLEGVNDVQNEDGTWSPYVPKPDLKANKIAELDMAAQVAMKSCKSSALGTEHTYVTDSEAMLLLTGEYTFVKGSDYDGLPIPWFTAEEGYVEHSANQFSKLYLDCRANVQGVKVKHDTLVRQVATATDEELVNIKW